MHPILFKIPVIGFPIHTYGALVALAFLVGMWWVTREARRKGLDDKAVSNLLFYIIIAAIIGSRVLHVIASEREAFLENPLMFFKVWEGGLVFYGGFLGALIVSIYFVIRHKLSFLKVCDCFAPAVALGHAIGRIGCLMAGCCYGRMVDANAWYAIVFPKNPDSFAPQGIPLFPTQIAESLGELLIFGILMIVRKKQRFDGQVIATYLMAYSVLRSVLEIFRGDVDRGFLIEGILSTSQFVSIFIFLFGAGIYVFHYMKRKESL